MINTIIRRIIGKTSAYSASKNNDRPETTFTNRGATGTVNVTLPTPCAQYLGISFRFKSVADFAIGFVATTAGDIVTKNNAAATSVKAQTGGELIGAYLEAECIETVAGTYKWHVTGQAVGHTYTVA